MAGTVPVRSSGGNQLEAADVEEVVQNSSDRAERVQMSFSSPIHAHRWRWPALTFCVAMLVTGCGTDDADSGAAATTEALTVTTETGAGSGETQDTDRTELDEGQDLFRSSVGENYAFTFDFVSSVTAEAGPISVEVVGGRVESATYPDAMTRQLLPKIPMLTVADFFERARSVLADGGLVEATLDRSYGYPTTMTFDPIPNAIDDEMSVRITSLDPTSEMIEADGY
jgi:hypothetical protein